MRRARGGDGLRGEVGSGVCWRARLSRRTKGLGCVLGGQHLNGGLREGPSGLALASSRPVLSHLVSLLLLCPKGSPVPEAVTGCGLSSLLLVADLGTVTASGCAEDGSADPTGVGCRGGRPRPWCIGTGGHSVFLFVSRQPWTLAGWGALCAPRTQHSPLCMGAQQCLWTRGRSQ